MAPALAIALSTLAHAEIHVAWNNCVTEANAVANMDYACDGSRDRIPFTLVASFVAPANLAAYVGMQAVADVHTVGSVPEPALPDWWKLGPGECRDGALFCSSVFTGVGTGTTGACQDPYVSAANSIGAYQWLSGVPTSDHAQLSFVTVRDTPTPLVMSQQYLAALLTLDPTGDVPNGPGGAQYCSGCCQPMQIDLQQIVLYQVAGTQPQDVYVLTANGDHSSVTWQASRTCTPTPVTRKTWGSIKTMYR